jgi:hypothetical protein
MFIWTKAIVGMKPKFLISYIFWKKGIYELCMLQRQSNPALLELNVYMGISQNLA